MVPRQRALAPSSDRLVSLRIAKTPSYSANQNLLFDNVLDRLVRRKSWHQRRLQLLTETTTIHRLAYVAV